MSEIRLHNPELKVEAVEDGTIQVLDSRIDSLIEMGILDCETVPSTKLSRIVLAIIGQLGMTWDGEAEYWDPMSRGLGGGIFMSNNWERVE